MALSTVWYFTDVGPLNGSTWLVPGSHRDLRNPRGADDDVDEHSPIAGEIQVILPTAPHCTWGAERRAEFSGLGPLAGCFSAPGFRLGARWNRLVR